MRHYSKIIFSALLAFALCCSISAFAKYIYLNTTIVVDPGKSAAYTIKSIKNDGVRITGNFHARGGNRNDIEVYILDDIGFENYSNNNQAETYYNSGRVTAGKIDVILRPGTYYLIFNNKFSVLSNKAIQVFIEVD